MNILVKDMGAPGVRVRPSFPVNLRYKVYIADFGIARHYSIEEDMETSTPVEYTKAYAAPEVVDQATRGAAADVFSLRCVFIEMIAALANTTEKTHKYTRDLQTPRNRTAFSGEPALDYWSELRSVRFDNQTGDTSYQANRYRVYQFIVKACSDIAKYRDLLKHGELDELMDLVVRMLHTLPTSRHTARELEIFFNRTDFFFPCPCINTCDPFVPAEGSLLEMAVTSF